MKVNKMKKFVRAEVKLFLKSPVIDGSENCIRAWIHGRNPGLVRFAVQN